MGHTSLLIGQGSEMKPSDWSTCCSYEWQVSITEDKQKCNYYLMRIIRRLCKLWDYGPSSHGVGTILGIISQWEIKDRAAKYWGGWEGTIFHNVLLTPIKACPLSKNIWVPPPWIIRSPPAKICLCAFSCYFHKIRQDLEVLVINMDHCVASNSPPPKKGRIKEKNSVWYIYQENHLNQPQNRKIFACAHYILVTSQKNSAGGNCSAPATPYHMEHPKMDTRGPRNGRQGMERGQNLGCWTLRSTFDK